MRRNKSKIRNEYEDDGRKRIKEWLQFITLFNDAFSSEWAIEYERNVNDEW